MSKATGGGANGTAAAAAAAKGGAQQSAAERRRSNVVKEVERLKENRKVYHFMLFNNKNYLSLLNYTLI